MVNRKKRLFFLTAAAVLCLIAASCGSASDGFDGRMAEPSITLLLKNNLPDESITTKAVEWFSEQVEERTEGRVKIEVLNNADMGDGRACLEQLQYGGTDIVRQMFRLWEIMLRNLMYWECRIFMRIRNISGRFIMARSVKNCSGERRWQSLGCTD